MHNLSGPGGDVTLSEPINRYRTSPILWQILHATPWGASPPAQRINARFCWTRFSHQLVFALNDVCGIPRPWCVGMLGVRVGHGDGDNEVHRTGQWI